MSQLCYITRITLISTTQPIGIVSIFNIFCRLPFQHPLLLSCPYPDLESESCFRSLSLQVPYQKPHTFCTAHEKNADHTVDTIINSHFIFKAKETKIYFMAAHLIKIRLCRKTCVYKEIYFKHAQGSPLCVLAPMPVFRSACTPW